MDKKAPTRRNKKNINKLNTRQQLFLDNLSEYDSIPQAAEAAGRSRFPFLGGYAQQGDVLVEVEA